MQSLVDCRDRRCSLGACNSSGPRRWTSIPRPAPDDPTPAGIAYLCEGRKEVAVVYAKNRASVTLGRQDLAHGVSADRRRLPLRRPPIEWSGRDDLAVLARMSGNGRPLAFNCRPPRRTT